MAKTFNYKNSTLAYQDEGQGYPIIFIGSYLCDRSMWKNQIKHLSQKYRCIVLEIWDHGQSGHLPTPATTLDELADDVWEFSQHLQLDQFAYFGLSIGGMIGGRLALKHPQAISVLGLLNTGFKEEKQEILDTLGILLNKASQEQVIAPETIKQISLSFHTENSFAKNAEHINQWTDDWLHADTKRLPGIVAIGNAVFRRASIIDQLSQLQMPTLSLTGDKDFIFPPDEAEEIAKRIKGSTCVIIGDSSHISPIDQPEKVTKAIEDLLSKI